MKQTDKFLQKENLATCENLEIPPRVLENYKTKATMWLKVTQSLLYSV